MRAYVDRIHAAGGELVIVGNGTPQQAQWFVEDFNIETPVFTDPEKRSYQVVGARHGMLSSVNPASILAGLKARRQGFKQTETRGDAVQQGGVFVVTPGGRMPYRFLSGFAGDHPDPEDAVRALEAAGAA